MTREQMVSDLIAAGVVHWAESWLYEDDELTRLWASLNQT